MFLLTMTDFMMALADGFEASFRFLASMNRNANIFFILIALLGAMGWCVKQMLYDRKAEEAETWK